MPVSLSNSTFCDSLMLKLQRNVHSMAKSANIFDDKNCSVEMYIIHASNIKIKRYSISEECLYFVLTGNDLVNVKYWKNIVRIMEDIIYHNMCRHITEVNSVLK